MPISYDLTKLDPAGFEHMVLALAVELLGPGATNFSPGPDGGRDTVFEGEPNYPSSKTRWSGTWYIQCKFHTPHLSKNSQTWLLEQIKNEIAEFERSSSDRKWPDNWIVATNVDPSGKVKTGSFDKAHALIKKANPGMKFDIWGGAKILTLLKRYPKIAEQYAHFVTPGEVIAKLRENLADLYADVGRISDHVITSQFGEQIYTKLEQAGSSSDSRPGIHKLFVDLPYATLNQDVIGDVAEALLASASRNQRPSARTSLKDVGVRWNLHPQRARVLVIKGGPGQGKSTIGQYVAQVQRAAYILGNDTAVSSKNLEVAKEIEQTARKRNHWPVVPRIPFLLELKDFAQWFGERNANDPKGVVTYISAKISRSLEMTVLPGTLMRAIGSLRWLVIFDGLDEVPNDVKDEVGREVRHFLDDIVAELDADVLALCTSRPQGYSGQFDQLDGPSADLLPLRPETALNCCEPLIAMDRSASEADQLMDTLRSAIHSPGVRDLMTTPLQSHIMAVVVRDGGRPPERRWQLFSNFYQVMKKRELLKGFPDKAIRELLNEQDKLLKTLHAALGFLLHSRAERSGGAMTQLSRIEFRKLVHQTVSDLAEDNIEPMVNTLMEATVERLVFVNTPDNAEHVRFDIRQLQEFFASEYIYEDRTADVLRSYLGVVIADSHWREVMHFLFSALVENRRATELAVAVTELERIDRREDSDIHIIHLRMASGALLAMRLLVEGVFEQDKKIRSQFRTVLKPIFALPDDRYFTELVGMREGTSKVWFINFALEVLRESAFSENIGAMLYLTKTLESKNPRTKDVIAFLRNSPIPYRDHVMRSFEAVINASRRRRNVNIESWILKYVLMEITEESWRHLAPDALRVMRMIATQDPETTLNVAKDVLDENELGLLKVLIFSFHEESFRHDNSEKMHGEISKYDWVTGQMPQEIWTPKMPTDVTQARGLLGVVARILDYAYSRTKEKLQAVSAYLSEAGQHIRYILPIHLIILLPDFEKYSDKKPFDLILTINDKDFRTKFGKRRIRAPRASRPIVAYYITTEISDADLLRLAQHSASIAVDVLLDRPTLTQHEKSSQSDDFVECLLNSPTSLITQLHRFGKLLRLFPNHKKAFRETVTQAALANPVDKTLTRIVSWNTVSPFLLNLPAEAALLPWLVNSFAKLSDSHFFNEQTHSNNLSEFLQFAPSKEILQQILEDKNLPIIQHAGAWIYLFMHASSLAKPEDDLTHLLFSYKVRIDEFINMPDSSWFIAAISRVCMNLPAECTKLIEPLVALLLESTSNRYLERVHVQRILDNWRERSAAPINASDLSERQSVIS